MPMLIIGGEKPAEEDAAPMKRPAKKFMGIGGKYAEPEMEDEDSTEEGSTDVDQARMFLDAIKSGNPRRTLEAFKALLQCCSEEEEE